MQVSLNWLKEYIDIDLSPQNLGDKLSMAGLVVERLEEVGDDWILEFESLANRPDWLSVQGIVREISAVTGKKRKEVKILFREANQSIKGQIKVTIKGKDLCPRYSTRVIKKIKVDSSPDWMVNRLQKSGIRSINNIIDITNYVLLEYGHPLHAFDLDQIEGAEIIVRKASSKTFIGVDGESYKLDEGTLVIADAQKAIAIAGVIGGQNSAVTETTKNIVLESAYFQPSSVRLTSKRLGLSTEASYRFERGADVDSVPIALDRAAALIQDLAGGEVLQDVIDEYETPLEAIVIKARVSRINKIIGLELNAQEMTNYLLSLDFDVFIENEDTMIVKVPNCRREVTREEDVAEEVARIFGYEYIPSTTPHLAMQHMKIAPMEQLIVRIRQSLIHLGLFETINYSFVNPTEQKELKKGSIHLTLPLSEDHSVMRRSLLIGLLKTVARNLAHNQRQGDFFELGQVYEVVGDERVEIHNLGILTVQGYRVLKGMLEELMEKMGLADRVSFLPEKTIWSDEGMSCDVCVDGEIVGYIGVLSTDKKSQFLIKDTKTEYAYLELELDLLLHKVSFSKEFQLIPKFPAAKRDLVLKMPEDLSCQDFLDAVESLEIDILTNMELFDIYRGDQIDAGLKSLGFALTFQSHERTLMDEEVDEAFEKILGHVHQKLGLTLRDK